MIQAGDTVVEVARWAGHSPRMCLQHLRTSVRHDEEPIDPDLEMRKARYRTGAGEDRATG
jgi:hypothetical protein